MTAGASIKSIKQMVTVLVISVVPLILVSCTAPDSEKVREQQKLNGVVAGPDEKTFVQKYNLSITLPMSEVDFLKILDDLRLPYELLSVRGGQGIYPEPFWSDSVNVSELQKIYRIEGHYDKASRITERYRVYVNNDNQVVYIENNFVYPDL